mmetsp:Transcript_1968/g.6406  ORF Transcript_1968/g.6406 Transcript_1968/m.6406 type:complete len:287 (+) Transcript_1968:764-1624(+)
MNRPERKSARSASPSTSPAHASPMTSTNAPSASCPYVTRGAVLWRTANPRCETPSKAMAANPLPCALAARMAFSAFFVASTRRAAPSARAHASSSAHTIASGAAPCDAITQSPRATTLTFASHSSSFVVFIVVVVVFASPATNAPPRAHPRAALPPPRVAITARAPFIARTIITVVPSSSFASPLVVFAGAYTTALSNAGVVVVVVDDVIVVVIASALARVVLTARVVVVVVVDVDIAATVEGDGFTFCPRQPSPRRLWRLRLSRRLRRRRALSSSPQTSSRIDSV